MKKCLIALFATLVLLGSSEAFAAETTVITPQIIKAATSTKAGIQQPSRVLPEGLSKEQVAQMEQRRDAFEKHINLTPEQREKIKTIRLQAKSDMEKIAADAAKKIDSVYTAEQRAKIVAEKAVNVSLEQQASGIIPVSNVKSVCTCSLKCACGKDCQCAEGKKCKKDCSCLEKSKK